MKDDNRSTLESIEELASQTDDLQARGILLAQPKEEELIKLLEDLRRELTSYEQDSSTERERILNRLTPVIEKLEQLLKGEHLQEMQNRIGKIETQLSSLEKTGERLEQILEDRSNLVRELRKENEELRGEFIFDEKIKPGVRTLIKLRDSVAGQLQDTDSGSNEIFLEAVEDKLLEALKDFGVVEVQASGDEYDPACQKVVEKTEVLERRKDKKVLEVLQAGYRHNKKLIRPQKVVLGQFTGGDPNEQDQ